MTRELFNRKSRKKSVFLDTCTSGFHAAPRVRFFLIDTLYFEIRQTCFSPWTFLVFHYVASDKPAGILKRLQGQERSGKTNKIEFNLIPPPFQKGSAYSGIAGISISTICCLIWWLWILMRNIPSSIIQRMHMMFSGKRDLKMDCVTGGVCFPHSVTVDSKLCFSAAFPVTDRAV